MSDFDPRRLPPPQPSPDSDTEGFWSATSDGHLELARCVECGHWHHPPIERCRRCAAATRFAAVSGRGTVYSFVIQRQPAVVGHFTNVPYVVAVIELSEQPGLRLTGRVVGVDPDDPLVVDRLIGSPVTAELEPLPGGDYTVAVWRVADSSLSA